MNQTKNVLKISAGRNIYKTLKLTEQTDVYFRKSDHLIVSVPLSLAESHIAKINCAFSVKYFVIFVS